MKKVLGTTIKVAIVVFVMWLFVSVAEIAFRDPLATNYTYSSWNMIVLVTENF